VRSYLLRVPEQLQRLCLSDKMQLPGWIVIESRSSGDLLQGVAKYLCKPSARK